MVTCERKVYLSVNETTLELTHQEAVELMDALRMVVDPVKSVAPKRVRPSRAKAKVDPVLNDAA